MKTGSEERRVLTPRRGLRLPAAPKRPAGPRGGEMTFRERLKLLRLALFEPRRLRAFSLLTPLEHLPQLLLHVRHQDVRPVRKL